ncbi:hypothetical protein [Legionella sp. 227]|uniref:hypothetical protein n=1 Tax=Legionella sp. 227 TaxID=3367288 RepID=UPI00370DA959
MQKKIELEVVQTASKVVLNYHKHPEVGGTGHVSIEATHEGKKHVISVYPSAELSAFTPLAISSMYVFPTKAVNHSTPSTSDSPVHASYDITDQIKDMDAVIEKIDELNELMNSGRASFSLTPGSVTKAATAVFNNNSSTSNMLLGLKMLDRDIIESEIAKVDVINCAEAVSRILEAGGMKRPEGIMSFAAPASINSHFASQFKKTEDTVTATEQSKTTATEEAPGLLRSMFNSVRDFFTWKETSEETQSHTQPIQQSSSSHDDDWPTYDSGSVEEPEKVDAPVEISSPEDEPTSRSEDTPSSRPSECSDSFFSSEPITAQKDDESDLDYCSRYESMVN